MLILLLIIVSVISPGTKRSRLLNGAPVEDAGRFVIRERLPPSAPLLEQQPEAGRQTRSALATDASDPAR
jgi:hypothetical protein